MSANTKKGLLFAVVAAILSGISIFYNKLIVVTGIDPLIFNILKNGGVAIVLTGILISTNKLPLIRNLSAKTWFKLGLIGLIGGSIPFMLFFDALRSVPALNANIIQKSLFIWVALLAIPFLGERLTFWQIVGYIVVVLSNLFIGGFTGFSGSRAEYMILAATILWSLENIIAKITLKETQSIIVAWARMFFGVLILISLAIVQNKAQLLMKVNTNQLLAICGSILLLTGYVTSWYRALKLAPATLVTSILILATPITNVLSATFITHTFPHQQLGNLIGTVIGLILIAQIVKLLRQPASTAVT